MLNFMDFVVTGDLGVDGWKVETLLPDVVKRPLGR